MAGRRSGGGAGAFSGMGNQNNGIVPFVRVAQFFDRPAIIGKLTKARHRYLNRAGAETRLIARRSMRRVGKRQKAKEALTGREIPSPPGTPPFARMGDLRESIIYGYDSYRDSGIVGPQLKRTSRLKNGQFTVPALHEYGGVRFNPRSGRDARYPARPYMAPALEKIQPRLPQIYAWAFRGAPLKGQRHRRAAR